MSITDELRTGGIYGFPSNRRVFTEEELTAIADRINAEYQKVEDELKAKDGQMWINGYAECRAELMEGNEVIAADLKKAGWVKLPLDADGVPIRVGDVLDGYGKTIEVVELRHGRSGWVLISRDGNGYADCAAFSHHHAPTVEDVTCEFLQDLSDWLGLALDIDYIKADGLFAEYAAKLQLKED